jgi:hypothetical protein
MLTYASAEAAGVEVFNEQKLFQFVAMYEVTYTCIGLIWNFLPSLFDL